MRRILWKEKESPNFARSGVIHVLTKTSVALIDNNIAKNGESRPIIALVEIIIIIIITRKRAGGDIRRFSFWSTQDFKLIWPNTN